MSELPENLQIIKTEQTSPTTSERSQHSIKARLNLHVKKRLEHAGGDREQQQQTKESSDITTTRQTQKQRRPYQKRNEKTKLESKNKRQKTKQQQKQTKVLKDVHSDEATTTINAGVALSNAAYLGGNAEDEISRDGSLERDIRSPAAGRDKDKCPDVLGMVLNVKKRALMHDPEVQDFLSKIMYVLEC